MLRVVPGDETIEGSGIRLALAFLLGLFVSGAILTFLALLGWLRAPAVGAVMLVGIGALTALVPERAGLTALWRSGLAAWREADLLEKLIAVAVSILALGFALSAWVRPPIGDAEAFYLVYAQLIAATGRLVPMPGYDAFSSIGLPGELHFAGLITLGGTPAAKLIVWPVAIAAAALLVRITASCGGSRFACLLAVAFLFTSTTFTHYIVDGKVDLVAAAFGLAAVTLSLEQWTKPIMPSWALLGFFAGAACVAKFSYLISLGPALACILLMRIHDGRFPTPAVAWRETLRVFLLTGLCAALAWIPQMVKNAVLFGAPLAPFLGGPKDNWLQQVWFSPEVTLRIVLSYPLALVFGRYPMQGGGLSVLLIAFAPLVLLLPKARFWVNSRLCLVTLAGLAGTVAWVVLRPSIIAPRYILATLLLFVPLIACASEHVWASARTSRLLRWGIFLTVAAACAAAAWHLLPVPRAAALLLAGRLPPCLLASGYCQPLRVLNAAAAPGDRVFLTTHYTYWLRPDLLQLRDDAIDRNMLKTSDQPLQTMRQLGFRYFVADAASDQMMVGRLTAELEAGGVDCIARSESVSVWHLPDISTGILARTIPAGRGQWRVERTPSTPRGAGP